MSARVLIVDDFAPNRALLEAHLTSEYFEVLTASNGADALTIAQRGDCDIVLLDVMMPGLDGFEVCRRLKRDPATHHIPVVLVTALDQPADRVRGLEAGAEDFLTKPIDEIALIARVRSLSRLKVVLDELRSRAATSATLGMPDPVSAAIRDDVSGARVLVIEDKASAARLIAGTLASAHLVDVESDPHEALFRGAEGSYDLFVVSLGLQGHDGLRLCSQFRSLERTRQVPILIVAELEDRQRLLRGLDLGVNDYVLRPIDANELIARARTQLRRKFYADSLRDNVQASIEMAIVDTLTGLNNRRFFNTNFAALMDQAARRGRPLSLMILDIDHFKQVNDTHGHDCRRPDSQTFRGADAPCRAHERPDLPARRRGVCGADARHQPRRRGQGRGARASDDRKQPFRALAGSRPHPGHGLDRAGRARRRPRSGRADAPCRRCPLSLEGRRPKPGDRRRRVTKRQVGRAFTVNKQ